MAIDLQKLQEKFDALFEDGDFVTEFENWVEGKSKSQWISVRNNLSEQKQIILAIVIGKFPLVCKYEGSKFYRYVENVFGDRLMGVYYDQISYWIPMPKPPLNK